MRARRKLIMMFAGGGLTHASGGVGTSIRYLTDEWATKPGTPEVRVVDTRGTGGKADMALHFFKALGLLLCWGCLSRSSTSCTFIWPPTAVRCARAC